MSIFFNKSENKEQKLNKLNIVIIVGFLICGLFLYFYQKYYWPKIDLTIAGQELKVLVAKTPARQYEGCSNKDNLGKYNGMLFIFNDYTRHPMVMRNMRFALDMIWLDGNEIVDYAKNLQPEPGKNERELTPYLGRVKNNMVLELPAGFLDKYEVKIGDKVEFKR
ncbi:MAG TPA: DUF192 domain-containing protein [Candidatus Magasanikbacteria bacterium]|nr:DUF192 domain-containing protein [Candidatus Magasanikbacteria bacterium]